MALGKRHSRFRPLRTLEARIILIKAELEDASKSRPSTRKKLVNRIQTAFNHQADPEFIESTIEGFVRSGILDFVEADKVKYRAA
jgi:hypothetical protein